MKTLKYKGLLFDDYVQDEFGTWAEVCSECAEKYHDVIGSDLDDGDTARGCCSVKGCNNSGDGDEKKHFYIDLHDKYEVLEKDE